jgi:hypothetical protein
VDKHTYAILITVTVAAVIAGAAAFSLQAHTAMQQQTTTTTVQVTTSIIATTTILQVKAEGPISVISGNVSYSYDNQTGITTITNSTNNATIGVKGGQRIALGNPSIVLPSSNLTNYSYGAYDILKSGNLTILKATYNATSGTYDLTLPWNATSLFQSIERHAQYCNAYAGLSSYLANATNFTNFVTYNVRSNQTVNLNYADLVIKLDNEGILHYYVHNAWNLVNSGGGHPLYLGVQLLTRDGEIVNPEVAGINISLNPNTINATKLTPNSTFLVNVTVNITNNATLGSYTLTLYPTWCAGVEEPLYLITIGSSAYVGGVKPRPYLP